MSATDLDLSAPLRGALIAYGDLTALLGLYEGYPSVHTRRPAPEGAEYPMAIVSGDIAIGDRDGLRSRRPVVVRDVAVYGRKGAPGDTSDQTREVEAAAYHIRALFHRQRTAITVPSYNVVSITASGPFEAPTEDEKLIGRVVSLTIHLQEG